MNTTTQSKTQPRDSVLARFMLGFEGDSISAELAEYLAGGLAGVVIYARNFPGVERLRELTGEIRRTAGRPVLIGIDQEGGTRFALKAPFTQWPSAAELGRLGDLGLIHSVARAIAMELQAVGCNLNFAPMLDLYTNPESPVTKDRSFGSDPKRVAESGMAFCSGLKAGGLLSCAKHFPGHGDAMIDPHEDLPIFSGTIERLESTELIPFAFAASEGVPLIMTAHILLPRIDPDNPASLSRVMLEGILRRRLKFNGVILADDLGMGAIAKKYGPGEAAVQILRAGTDIAMLCHDWSAVAPAIAAVRKAHNEQRFEDTEWNASLDRIEHVCAQAESSTPVSSREVLGCDEFRALAEDVRARLL